MEQAISQAKIQTAKEITQHAKEKKIRKNVFIYVFIIIALLILAYFVYHFIQVNKYGFVDKESGITFSSGDFYLSDAMNSLSNDNNYFLIINVLPEDMNSISIITPQISYLLSVFAAKNKNVVFIINIMDSKRVTISCQSNLGDIYTNQELNREDCLALLNSGTSSIIIDFPTTSIKESIVTVNANIGQRYIYIQTKTKEELDRAVYLTTRQLFSDIEKIEEAINNVRKNLGNDVNSLDTNKPNDTNFVIDTNQSIDVNLTIDTNTFDQNI